MVSAFDRVENNLGKGENADCQHLSISHNVFTSQFHYSRGKSAWCEKGVNAFPKQVLVFTCLQYKPFENTVGKGEIARIEQFLLFPQCFLLFWRTQLPGIFIKFEIIVCKLFQFGKV